MLRDLVMELACFWNLDGGLDKASDERMEQQYGGGFDQAVSEARQSGQVPEFTDQAKWDVLTGLEVYMQEMTLNGEWVNGFNAPANLPSSFGPSGRWNRSRVNRTC